MRRTIMLGVAAALLVACSDGASVGGDGVTVASGQAGERRFAIEGFDSVALAGPDAVDVREGPGFAVVARGDTGILRTLRIERRGSTLHVGRTRGFQIGTGAAPIRVTVTMPMVRGVALAGSGDLTVDRAAGEALTASLGGSGNIRIGRANVRSAALRIGGSGDITMAGRADAVTVAVGGSGNVDAGGLQARTATVSVAGSGNVRLAVDGAARVRLAGSGDVDLGAQARCDVSRVGSGEVRCGGR